MFYFDDADDVDTQFTRFVNYKSFKWAFESMTGKGEYQIITGVVFHSGNFRIRTNSLEYIFAGDYIELHHPALPNLKPFEKPIIIG